MSKYVNLIKAVLAALALFTLGSCELGADFTNKEEINKQIEDYQNATDYQASVDILTSMIANIHNPQSKEEDQVVKYTLSRLVEIYESTNDVAILAATDGVKMDGGFANYMCEFYKKVSKMEGFFQYYFVDNDSSVLEKCIGISFSTDEFNKLKSRE